MSFVKMVFLESVNTGRGVRGGVTIEFMKRCDKKVERCRQIFN